MSRKRASENLQFAIFFLIFVGGIVVISLVFRAFFLLKETKFDGSSHFTLKLNEGKETQFISFSPQNSSIGIVTFINIPAPSEIPIDAKTNSNLNVDSKNLKDSLFKMMFDFKNQQDVNFIDFLRFILFSQTLKDDSIVQISISNQTKKSEVNSILSSYFLDPKIQDEKLSIEVINSTDIYGLGNRIANLLSNAGANVVLVSTGDLRKKSEIDYSSSSYTVEKLNKLLKFKINKVSKKSLADVTIVIGEDLEH